MNELTEAKQVQIIQLFDLGYSNRAVSRIAGCNRNTAYRYQRIFIRNAICPCGKFAKHKGWCKWRFSHSQKRQEYMRSIGHLKREVLPLPPTLFFPYIVIPKCEDCGEPRNLGARFCGHCYWQRAIHSTVNVFQAISLDAVQEDSLTLHERLAANILSPDEILMRKEEAELERKYRMFNEKRNRPVRFAKPVSEFLSIFKK